MSGIKISNLPAASSAQLTDVFPVDQLPGPVTYKESNQQLLDLFQANLVVTDSNFSGVLSSVHGGTGVNNGSSTLTLGGNLTTSGAFATTFTMTGATNVTFPTSGTLATTGGIVTSVTGTTNRITSTGGTTPVIDISASYVGQSSITTLGTIGTGVWQGTVIGGTYGGTGVNNGASTITLGGSLTTSGAFASTFTMTGITGVTFPTSGTLATTSQIPTGAALTKADDTNVTLTLGGSPTTALVNAASITAGWTGTLSGTRGGTGVNNGASTITLGGSLTTSGAFASTFTMTNTTGVTFPTSGTLATTSQIPSLPLSLANGGTNANLTASNGGIFYSTASAGAILSGTATAGQIIRSGASTTPSWSTTTYPATNAVNTLLYASSANVMAALATANSSVLVTDGSGVPSLSTTLPSGISATNMALTTPTMAVVNDTNGNEITQFFPTASAVNYLRIQNNSTGNGVILTAFGGDANVLLSLRGRGNQGAAVQGTGTNDAAAAGYVGEIITSNIASGSAVSLSTGTPKNLTSISLTAGDWDVYGNVKFLVGTSATAIAAWISSTSASVPDSSLFNSLLDVSGTTGTVGISAPYINFQLASTTTIYISAQATFTGTTTMCGSIIARRVR